MQLSDRDLNRTLLARQSLLSRSTDSVDAMVSTLVAVQAQEAAPPYTALWARLERFDPEGLTEALASRRLVRGTAFRCTIMLMTAAAYSSYYPLVHRRFLQSNRSFLLDDDITRWTSEVRLALRGGQYSGAALQERLEALLPGYPEGTFAPSNALRSVLALVRTPRSGRESQGSRDLWMPAEDWLGHELGDGDAPSLVRAYLNSYGPASVADAANFTGLSRLGDAFGQLDLVRYTGEDGRVLYDNNGGVITSGDVDAPPRLVAAFDNLVLGHADRTRVMRDEHRWRHGGDGHVRRPMILLDGMMEGVWRPWWDGHVLVVTLSPYRELKEGELEGLTAEAERWRDSFHFDSDIRVEVVPELQ